MTNETVFIRLLGCFIALGFVTAIVAVKIETLKERMDACTIAANDRADIMRDAARMNAELICYRYLNDEYTPSPQALVDCREIGIEIQ